MDLSRFQELYKSRARIIPLSERVSLTKRLSTAREQRQSSRNTLMMERRNIPNGIISPFVTPSTTHNLRNNRKKNVESEVPVIKNARKEKLMKWLEDKKKRLERENQKKKPLFKVTHVTHNEDLTKVYSQIKGKQVPNKKSNQPETIAPSLDYKFKPPMNVKPLELKKPTGGGKKKTQKLGEKPNSISHQPAVPVSKHKPAECKCADLPRSRNGNKDLLVTKQKSPNRSKNVTNKRTQKEQVESVLKTPTVSRSLRSRTKCIDPAPQPSTSGIPQMKKTNKNKDGPKILSTSSESDGHIEKPLPRTRTLKNKSKKVETDSTTTITTRRSAVLRKPQSKATTRDQESTNTTSSDDSLKQENKLPINGPQLDKSSSSLSSEYPLSETNNTTPESAPSISRPVTPVNNENHITYISPFVTVSRGRVNARHEYQRRSEFGGYDNEESTSPKAAAAYFYRLLNNQIVHLQQLCEEWSTYKKNEQPAEEACDMINVAIGQTELLINKKFQQFRELINMCETGNSEKPVQCLDLHGFWDMISIQVGNIDKRFENLQRLKNNHWEEILPEVKNQQINTRPTRKATKKAPKKNSSSVRAFIQAQRKKAAKEGEKDNIDVINNRVLDEVVHNPRVTALVSPAKRKLSSPGLTIMKVTQAAKFAGKLSSEGNTPTTTGQSINTPKSILKSQRRSRSEIRKSKAVLFKDDRDSSPAPKQLENQENDINISNIALGTPQGKTTPRRSKRLSKYL